MKGRNFTVLKKPYLSEKSYLQGQLFNTYTFVIERGASKEEVKRDVESLFNVEVKKVRTIKGRDKKKRVGKYTGVKKGKFKALVTLKEGHTLDFFGEVEKSTPKDEKEAKKEAKKESKEAKKESKETKKEVKKSKKKEKDPSSKETKTDSKEKDNNVKEVKDAG